MNAPKITDVSANTTASKAVRKNSSGRLFVAI
jgi:hypothetical protein